MTKLTYAQKVLANLHINPNFTTHTYTKGWSEQFFIDPTAPSELNPVEAVEKGQSLLMDFTTTDLPALNTDIIVLGKGGKVSRANWKPASGVNRFELASEFVIGKTVIGSFEVVKPTEFHQVELEKQDEIGQLSKVVESWPVVTDPNSGFSFAGPKLVGSLLLKDFQLKSGKAVSFWTPIHASSNSEKVAQIQNFQKVFMARNQYDMDYMIAKKYFGAQKQMIDGQAIKQSLLVSSAKQFFRGRAVSLRSNIGFDIMVVKKA